MNEIIVIGGGLAGVEAAWQAAKAGARVRLFEMRPVKQTPAHRTDKLAEIVCSNSLKSDEPGTASYLLKEELRRANSLVMEAAKATRVPAGPALAVDREQFAEYITERIAAHPRIEIVREEATTIPREAITIIATGPLTSATLTDQIMKLTGDDQLYFYDAIAPIIAADSIDQAIAFKAARYGKGGDDYLNCPMNEAEYARFYQALIEAKSVPLQRFEETRWFEACLPIEEMARRGVDTLRYGPMKPVGLIDPRSGNRPYAVVQLRQETLKADSYNLVGFQNHLRFGEQERVFRMIPGLEQAKFTRLGQIHRNTFINSPRILNPTLQAKKDPRIFFAGQISGVEGYVECVATGLITGINATRLASQQSLLIPPRASAIGSLIHYLICADPNDFQPENINFGIMPAAETPTTAKRIEKKEEHLLQVKRALRELSEFASAVMAEPISRVVKGEP